MSNETETADTADIPEVDLEAARMVTWPEVVEARRQAAANPQPLPDDPAPATTEQTTPAPAAAPAAPAVDVQALVDASVTKAVAPLAQALETLAERLSGPQAAQNPPEAAPAGDTAAQAPQPGV